MKTVRQLGITSDYISHLKHLFCGMCVKAYDPVQLRGAGIAATLITHKCNIPDGPRQPVSTVGAGEEQV